MTLFAPECLSNLILFGGDSRPLPSGMRQNAAHGFVEINQSARIALNIFTSLLMALCPIWAPSSRIALTPQQRSRLEPLEQATKLSAAASQAVALNLVDAPPPPVAPLSPMPTLPDHKP